MSARHSFHKIVGQSDKCPRGKVKKVLQVIRNPMKSIRYRLLQLMIFVHTNSYALLQAHGNKLPVTDNASVPPANPMAVRISRFFIYSITRYT